MSVMITQTSVDSRNAAYADKPRETAGRLTINGSKLEVYLYSDDTLFCFTSPSTHRRVIIGHDGLDISTVGLFPYAHDISAHCKISWELIHSKAKTGDPLRGEGFYFDEDTVKIFSSLEGMSYKNPGNRPERKIPIRQATPEQEEKYQRKIREYLEREERAMAQITAINNVLRCRKGDLNGVGLTSDFVPTYGITEPVKLRKDKPLVRRTRQTNPKKQRQGETTEHTAETVAPILPAESQVSIPPELKSETINPASSIPTNPARDKQPIPKLTEQQKRILLIGPVLPVPRAQPNQKDEFV